MDLELISGKEDDVYKHQLEISVSSIFPDLLERDVWDKAFIESIPKFSNEHIGKNSPIIFEGIPPLLSLELKLYWAKLLSDTRFNSRSNVERRRLPMEWFRKEGGSLLRLFNVPSFANIPHPEFPLAGLTTGSGRREHNQKVVEAFSSFKKNSSRDPLKIEYPKDGQVKEKEYLAGRITIIGDFHKKIFMSREQFKPLQRRNIIYLNDIYSEHDIRFKDIQRQSDHYLNFYLFPEWIRPAIREHILQKVEYGELAPKTLPGYFGRMKHFKAFMHERFPVPSPALISNSLMEDEFVAWGNKKGLVGKNWFTDCMAMLSTAARKWPDQWPSVSVSNRAANKIEKVHYKGGLGRMGHNQEGANRSYSQRIIDEIRVAVEKTPSPIPAVFTLILSTGIRAEDGHAILFDCLHDDPHDQNYMLLTFWQNKVRKWNTKPLLKSEPQHAELKRIIENQREEVMRRHGKPTKYLFPAFNGTHESFMDPSYSLKEIKRQCLKDNVLADDGSALSFSWHPIRHTKGTSLAKDGHDILSIMMELGHSSPDMATVYINNRLELKKKALLENGGGRFYTIEGLVDDRVTDLLVRKDQISATRVCGGACAMPAQIGDWCEHANACYTCKHYRADAKDVEFFKSERSAIIHLIEEQQEEAHTLEEHGRLRMSEITHRRLNKNKEVYTRMSTIISAIEEDGEYQGADQQCKQLSLGIDS